MKTKELRELSLEGLQAKLEEARRKQFDLRFQKATGQTQDKGQSRDVKKTIARIMTLMTEKQAQKA
ncbi:MAG: 50S ribosomal protein L29 [Candidatus Cloacimonetes bacterium]|jgi:large subunit ribosomal protein L29|nr:50S ribosomal protein L29 [Candidatus Cloacimonadota bacterium]